MMKFYLISLVLMPLCFCIDRPWIKDKVIKVVEDNVVVNLRMTKDQVFKCPLNSTDDDPKFAQWFKETCKGDTADGFGEPSEEPCSKADEIVYSEGRYDFPSLETFSIDNLSSEDQGWYHCTEAFNTTKIKRFRLIVIDDIQTTDSTRLVEPPVWSLIPPIRQTLDSSKHAVIPCKVYGTDAEVDLFRLRDDGSIYIRYNRSSVGPPQRQALVILRPTIADSGDYMCVAQNTAGKLEHRFSIKIKVDGGLSDWGQWSPCDKACGYGMKTRRRECNNPEPTDDGRPCRGRMTEFNNCRARSCQVPYLTSFGFDLGDDNLVLTCKAKGIPTPTIKWRLNGQDFSSFFDYTNSVFKIKRQRATTGSYSCTVRNSVGYFTMYISIQL